MFCALTAEIDEDIATAGMIAKPFSLPTTPTAEPTTGEIPFASAVMKRNDIPVAMFCTELGRPMRSSIPSCWRSI